MTANGSDERALDVEEELVQGAQVHSRIAVRAATAAAVIAGLVAAGVWYVTRPAPALVVTYAGDRVDNAADVITHSDASFFAYVRNTLGAVSKHAGCFYDRTGGRARTDVSNILYCGPVLYYGQAPPNLYLRFAIAPHVTGSGHVQVVARTTPDGTTPAALPDGAHLERPDHDRPPRGADGLVAPSPPPAPYGLFERVTAADLPALTPAPNTAIIGSRDITVALTATGYVTHYGRGAYARSAPPGERLLAFELQLSDGEVGGLASGSTAPIAPAIGLTIDGGAVRPLPLRLNSDPAAAGWPMPAYFVVAVRASMRTADLIVTDAGITQRVSALTGVTGADNIAMLARHGELDGTAQAAVAAAVNITAHGTTTTTALSILVEDQPTLRFFSEWGPQHASAPDRAWLHLKLCFVQTHSASPDACFGASDMTLLPAGGTPVRAFDPGNAGYPVFDVPDSFRRGIVIISSSPMTFGGETVTLIHPYRVLVSFSSNR